MRLRTLVVGRRMQRLLIVAVLGAVLAIGLAASGSARPVHQAARVHHHHHVKAHAAESVYTASSGSGWLCVLGAGIVGAGVGALTAGVTGGLAATGFAAGCDYRITHGDQTPYIIVGLPKVPKGCWYVFPHEKRANHEVECAA